MPRKPQPIKVEVEYVPDDEGYIRTLGILVRYIREDRAREAEAETVKSLQPQPDKWTDRVAAVFEEYYQEQLLLPDGNVVRPERPLPSPVEPPLATPPPAPPSRIERVVAAVEAYYGVELLLPEENAVRPDAS
jgi:hypothetical protein